MNATIVFEQNWDAIHATNPDGSRKFRYIVNTGSSRSSETTSLIDCYDLTARANTNMRLTVWRDTKTDCKKTVLNDALKHLKRDDRYLNAQDFNKTESIFTYNTGSTFEIHGTDDENTVMGLNQDIAWLNEPYKISRSIFDQIDQRTAECIIIDWNPKMGHWIDDIVKDPRTKVIHSTIRDNPFCPPEERIKVLSYQPVSMCAVVMQKKITEQAAMTYDLIKNELLFSNKEIKELSRCRENVSKNTANLFNWQVYGLGIKGERPNRIFHFTEISLEQYRALDTPVFYGCDWGTVDPWGIIEAKYYDGGLYLHELNYASENEIRQRLTATELAQINTGESEDERREACGLVTWLFSKLNIRKDRPVICDTNRPLKGNALRKGGWQAIPAVKLPGSIVDGIDLLNNIRVYYTSTSENLRYEQENYSREVDRYGVILEEPEDMDNHTLDSSRYIAQYLQAKGIIKVL